MAIKSANLYARIEPEIKEQAESILQTLGIPASNAINMFYKQIILQGGIPFDVRIPKNKLLDMSDLTDEELDIELKKGYSDYENGKVKSVSKVFNDIKKDYNI